MTESKNLPGSLLLIGCGNMGGALLEGWYKNFGSNMPEVTVVEPGEIQSQYKNIPFKQVRYFEEYGRDKQPEVVVLAVKPQTLSEVLPRLKAFAASAQFISIAAGKSLSFYESYLGSNVGITRVMPNLPATIGKGFSGCFSNASTTKQQRQYSNTLLSAVGEVSWLEKESDMDAITALSGSGPAYFYYMIEVLTQVGISLGLDSDSASKAATATFTGAAALLEKSKDSPELLRERVTSKGGTTEAGISVLSANGALHHLLKAAVSAAHQRSVELSKKD